MLVPHNTKDFGKSFYDLILSWAMLMGLMNTRLFSTAVEKSVEIPHS